MTRFLTDGTRVFEILGVAIEKNAGLMAGNIRRWLLREVPDGDPFSVSELAFNELTPLESTGDTLVLELHRDLDNWAKERPSWMG